eukprot:6539590-Pyramimonas_sp.AAC.1
MVPQTRGSESIDDAWAGMVGAFEVSGGAVPEKYRISRRPWVSQCTLDLIDQRSQARLENDQVKQRDLHRKVRRSAKADKTKWLNDCIQTGTWDDLKLIRKTRRPTQSSLRNAAGVLTPSEEKADTMAEYLERVQWRVRPAGCTDGPPLGPALNVNEDAFSAEEVKAVIRKMRNNRAAGGDDIPAEYFK